MNYKYLGLTCGILLLIAIPNWLPYGFYIIIRWIISVASVLLALNFKDNKNQKLSFTFWAVAILFNPIIPIYLNKDIWVLVDLVVSILFFFISSKIKSK